jgi:release factor glutamine methyltransferase
VRHEHPFGPVLTARHALLRERGLVAADQRTEELVVVRAVMPSVGQSVTHPVTHPATER